MAVRSPLGGKVIAVREVAAGRKVATGRKVAARREIASGREELSLELSSLQKRCRRSRLVMHWGIM